jgi:hypothetical protein
MEESDQCQGWLRRPQPARVRGGLALSEHQPLYKIGNIMGYTLLLDVP